MPGRFYLLLEPGKPDSFTRVFAGSEIRERGQRATAVDGGFLENLLRHLGTPCQPGYLYFGDPSRVDSEDPSCGFGLLPGVERLIRSNRVHGTGVLGGFCVG